MFFVRDGGPAVCDFAEGDDDGPSVRAVEGRVHFVEAVEQSSHLEDPQPLADFDGVVAGKARHGVALINRVRVLIGLSLTVQLIHQKHKVVLPQFLPKQQRRLADPHHCLSRLPADLLEPPALLLDLRPLL